MNIEFYKSRLTAPLRIYPAALPCSSFFPLPLPMSQFLSPPSAHHPLFPTESPLFIYSHPPPPCILPITITSSLCDYLYPSLPHPSRLPINSSLPTSTYHLPAALPLTLTSCYQPALLYSAGQQHLWREMYRCCLSWRVPTRNIVYPFPSTVAAWLTEFFQLCVFGSKFCSLSCLSDW